MTNPRSKKEPLSKTCISYLEDRVKEEYYWRKKLLKTNAIQKGIECENEAVFVLNKALGRKYRKSIYKSWEKMENERCTGHEDIDDTENKVTIDTKVCETFDTFPILTDTLEKDYWRQGQAYMWLKWEEYRKHIVAKVLVNSPMWQVKDKLYRIYMNLTKKYEDSPEYIDEEYEQEARQVFLSHVFDQQIKVESNGEMMQLKDEEVIPYKQRVRLFEIERDDKAIESIKTRVQECRDYLTEMWF